MPEPRHIRIDPLNPPKEMAVLTILQYKDERGNVVQDVQSHLMKDIRNEAYIMHMMDAAKNQLAQWFKEQKAIRKIR